MNSAIQLKIIIPSLLTALTLLCPVGEPKAQAVSPSPDGGYPGGNTAEGASALFSLNTGSYNTAVGFFSLRSNTIGSLNTATGAGALFLNAGANPNTASANTATGAVALLNNTTGFNNTATGVQALVSNTTGDHNTADGNAALLSNTTGFGNTASGVEALFNNTSGFFNTALGFEAGNSVTTASNVIAIGTAGANVSNSCYIGHIYGTFNTAQSAVVYVDPDGRLGTGTSARRFKKDIADMGAASEVLLSMRPVTFHFKTQDTEKAGREISQFGLIAEEVAEVNPDLILRDKEGEIYSVRYDAVNAMLLNEFLKEHRKNEKQETTIAELKTEIASLFATVKEQAVQIQKVSAQIGTSKAAPQTVLNRQ
jgi:Chaperone of endosialidase